MSERVQLLLSDRILGMTLVPEGRVWNYGIGLTQLWAPSLSYAMILDTPLLFWAEEHRPAAFLTVSLLQSRFVFLLTLPPFSLQTSNKGKTVLMWKIVFLNFISSFAHVFYNHACNTENHKLFCANSNKLEE